MKILFVEDNSDDVELLVLELERQGFDITWKRIDLEKDLRAVLSEWIPDIILSDYTMPAFNGLAALEITQEIAPQIPFIFVSGTIGEEGAIEAMYKGATDYVLKDNLRRLNSSITRAVNAAKDRQRMTEVERERSRLAAILEATSDYVLIANPQGTILYLNQSTKNLLGSVAEVKDLNIKTLQADWSENFGRDESGMFELDNGIWQGESVLLAKDGSEIPVSQVVISHKNEDGENEYYSFISRDIRDRKAFEKKIQYLANFDLLTGLPNKTLLADRTAQAINYCQWTNRSIAILVIDIDRFKMVNDGYGRDIGDELLKQFGERLKQVVRPRDTIARLSADSFAVLATELSSPEDAINVVSKARDVFKRAFNIGDRSLNISTGIGISLFPRDGKNFTSLLQNADVAMHRTKEKGEDGFQFYASEMTRSAAHRVKLENELSFALVHQEIELYYQPQIYLEDESIIGVEALMRWNHPEKGILMPGLFIPIAENSDLINALGEWALATACHQLKQWDRVGAPMLNVAVNVSARQFRSKGFPERVERVLQTSGLEPHRLELELTESILVYDHEAAVCILNQLNELGVKIAMDDFGTGYSNLSYLSRLPINCLKIDKSFVQRSLTDKNDAEIVRAIISLSDALELRVVAEGIETEEQLHLLRDHQCREGQGFLFAHPLPADDIYPILPQRAIRSR